MKRNILSLCASFAVVFATAFTTTVNAQTAPLTPEQIETFGASWNTALENVRVKYGASTKDYETFKRFDLNALQLLKAQVLHKVKEGHFEQSTLTSSEKDNELDLGILYEKFLKAKKTYPTSVEEYSFEHKISTTNPCDSTGCTNIGFEDGDFSGWYGYYATNSSTFTTINITGITGGALGPVTQGADDPNVTTYTAQPHDYQLNITSSGYDKVVPTIPRVSPWGGSHSVMLGDSQIMYYGVAILSKTFLVTPNTANLTYQYAVFLNNPGHPKTEQPFFVVAVLDQNGDTVPNCGTYNVTSGYGTSNFDSINYLSVKTYYRDWTIVNVPLKNYVGQCVTIEFKVVDCAAGGHFGYAYVDATCSPLGLIASSPGFCGQDSILLTAPPGAQTYAWTGPTNGIKGDTTKQSIWVDSTGTYRVITIPVTGAKCADTLTINIGKAPGPPPHPNFYADTVCAGSPTKFFNTSNPSNGKFSWDFYNIGVYNLTDTNNFNPTWSYATPGVYHVKLHEIYNGCGVDTVLTIVVDTIPKGSFSASSGCTNTPVTFTNLSSGGQIYSWNFGDPSSNPYDTSSAMNPVHTFTAAGTYTVTLIVGNKGQCKDTVKATFVFTAPPKPIITGLDTICPGTEDTLRVTGGTTYVWTINGSTNNWIAGKPTTTTTYVVRAYNGSCEHDTSFTVNVVPTPAALIKASKDSVCAGDTLTLQASGATSYTWEPGGSTSKSITVTLSTIKTYTLEGHGGKCLALDSIKLTLIKPITAKATQSTDSICPGSSVVLSTAVSGSVATGYLWSNGATTSSITVSPTTTTTYTATVEGKCNNVNNILTVTVVPPPVPTIKGTLWKCSGVKDTLKVTSSTNPTTYVWSNGKTTTTYITGPIFADSNVYVVAKNALGCSDTTYFHITLRHPPAITYIPPAIACAGSNVLLTAKASGVGPFTYQWLPGNQTTDTISVSPLTKTSYTVIVSNGCKSTKATLVTPDNPNVKPSPDKTIIIGDDTVIWAYGKGIVSYNWQDTNGITCRNPPLCDSISVSPTVTTTYTVYATDTMGCVEARVITVFVEVPCFDIIVPNVITPNYAGPGGTNGGYNNEFYIQTKYMDGWSVTIYDRWGKEMFKSTDPNKFWNCTTESGAEASDGVYYYIITGSCQQRTYKKQGFVQVIR